MNIFEFVLYEHNNRVFVHESNIHDEYYVEVHEVEYVVRS